MNNHKRHKFLKESVMIKDVKLSHLYQRTVPRKVIIYKCKCEVKQSFYRMAKDDDLLFDFYYSDPI